MYPNQDYQINHPGTQPAGGPPRKPLRPKRRLKLPLLLIVILAGVIAYMYFTDQSEDDAASIGGQVVPLIKADASSEKEKPEDPGGMDIPHQDKLVFDQMEKSGGADDSMQVENLLPPAEQPQALPEGQAADQFKEIVVTQHPEAKTEGAAPAPAAAPVENLTQNEPAPAPEAPVVAKEEPAPTPPPAAPAPEPAKVAAAPTPAKESAQFAAEAGGSYWLQLVSLKSVDAAQSAAKVFAKKHPSVLGQLDINVAKADLGAKGTFYRLQFGAFKQKADAQKACAALKEEKQDCIIVQN